jgi:hypothetical protein
MPQVELAFEDLFKIKAEIVVIPRSTAGTFGAPFKDLLEEWRILDSGTVGSTLGSLTYWSAKTLPEKRGIGYNFPYAGIAFATSVKEQNSTYAAIHNIGRELGLLTQKQEIGSIATPLHGTGAGSYPGHCPMGSGDGQMAAAGPLHPMGYE